MVGSPDSDVESGGSAPLRGFLVGKRVQDSGLGGLGLFEGHGGRGGRFSVTASESHGHLDRATVGHTAGRGRFDT